MVGYFKPFISTIKDRTDNLYIMERNPRVQDEGVLPDTRALVIILALDFTVRGLAFSFMSNQDILNGFIKDAW
jgi:uncharacterized protein (DUF4213/DUF364 family)